MNANESDVFWSHQDLGPSAAPLFWPSEAVLSHIEHGRRRDVRQDHESHWDECRRRPVRRREEGARHVNYPHRGPARLDELVDVGVEEPLCIITVAPEAVRLHQYLRCKVFRAEAPVNEDHIDVGGGVFQSLFQIIGERRFGF